MPGKTEQKKGVQRSPITPLEFQYEEMFSSDAKKLLVSLRAGRYVFKSDAGGGLKCHYTNPFVPYRVHFYLLSLMQPNLTLLLLIQQQIELHLTAACGAADDRIC